MSEMPTPKIPQPTALTRDYWRAASEGTLLVQQCEDCSGVHAVPRHYCPLCLSSRLAYLPTTGFGVLYSYTVVRRAASKAFAALVPYVVAIVELDEGVRVFTNIVGTSPGELTIGDRVSAVFDRAGDEVGLVRFELAIEKGVGAT